jgi:hypothetical protein
MNWKTTASGAIGAAVAILSIIKAILNGQPFDPALIPAAIAGVGLVFAADAKK